MTDIVDELKSCYRDTKQMIPCELEHRAAQEIESLRQQLAEALSVRETCTLVPTHELKKLHEQLAEKDAEIARRVTVDEMNVEIESSAKSVADHYEAQLADSESERLEQARLLGMSGEREAGLLAEIARLKEVVKKRTFFLNNATEQLTIVEAREQRLRDAATMAEEMIATNAHERRHVRWKLQDALALPQDTTALDQLKAQVAHKAGEVMRERCAHEADPFENITNALATHIAQSILALPGVTLEDLK